MSAFNPREEAELQLEHELELAANQQYTTCNEMIAEGVSNFLISLCIMGAAVGFGIWIAYLCSA